MLLGHLCMIPPRRHLQAFNSMPSTGRQLMAVPPRSLPPAHAGFHLQNTGCFPRSTASLCTKPTRMGTAKPVSLRPAPPRQRLLARSSQASYSSSGENRKSRRETKTQEHGSKTQPNNVSLANTGLHELGQDSRSAHRSSPTWSIKGLTTSPRSLLLSKEHQRCAETPAALLVHWSPHSCAAVPGQEFPFAVNVHPSPPRPAARPYPRRGSFPLLPPPSCPPLLYLKAAFQ